MRLLWITVAGCLVLSHSAIATQRPSIRNPGDSSHSVSEPEKLVARRETPESLKPFEPELLTSDLNKRLVELQRSGSDIKGRNLRGRRCRPCRGPYVPNPDDCRKCDRCPPGTNPDRQGNRCQTVKDRIEEDARMQREFEEEQRREEQRRLEEEERIQAEKAVEAGNKIRRMARCLFIVPYVMPLPITILYNDEYFDEDYLLGQDLLNFWPTELTIAPIENEGSDAILESPEYIEKWISSGVGRGPPSQDRWNGLKRPVLRYKRSIKARADASHIPVQLYERDVEKRVVNLIPQVIGAVSRTVIVASNTIKKAVEISGRVELTQIFPRIGVAQRRSRLITVAQQHDAAEKISQANGWKQCLQLMDPPQ